ncbi:unnamed protein product [Arctogadus glacialis]
MVMEERGSRDRGGGAPATANGTERRQIFVELGEQNFDAIPPLGLQDSLQAEIRPKEVQLAPGGRVPRDRGGAGRGAERGGARRRHLSNTRLENGVVVLFNPAGQGLPTTHTVGPPPQHRLLVDFCWPAVDSEAGGRLTVLSVKAMLPCCVGGKPGQAALVFSLVSDSNRRADSSKFESFCGRP